MQIELMLEIHDRLLHIQFRRSKKIFYVRIEKDVLFTNTLFSFKFLSYKKCV